MSAGGWRAVTVSSDCEVWNLIWEKIHDLVSDRPAIDRDDQFSSCVQNAKVSGGGATDSTIAAGGISAGVVKAEPDDQFDSPRNRLAADLERRAGVVMRRASCHFCCAGAVFERDSELASLHHGFPRWSEGPLATMPRRSEVEINPTFQSDECFQSDGLGFGRAPQAPGPVRERPGRWARPGDGAGKDELASRINRMAPLRCGRYCRCSGSATFRQQFMRY